jgi:hypothetical protein
MMQGMRHWEEHFKPQVGKLLGNELKNAHLNSEYQINK